MVSKSWKQQQDRADMQRNPAKASIERILNKTKGKCWMLSELFSFERENIKERWKKILGFWKSDQEKENGQLKNRTMD